MSVCQAVFRRESADKLTDGNTDTQTDRNTGPILLPRPLTWEVKMTNIPISQIGLMPNQCQHFWPG